MIQSFPEQLVTQRLRLSRPTDADLPDLDAMHANAEVMATLGGLRTAEELTALYGRLFGTWQRDGFGLWIMRNKEDSRFIGRGGLRRVHIGGNEEVEIGYALVPEFWGQGLALELAKECLRVGFEIIGLEEMVCFTLPTNKRSQRVMEKAGFVYERNVDWAGTPHVLYRIRRRESGGTP